jgi:cytochrome c oxidase subunit I
MADYDTGADAPEIPWWGLLGRMVFRTDHKTIGLQYLGLALCSVFAAMALSLVMRIHLAWPGLQLPLIFGLGNVHERYAELTMLHGSLMVFVVLTAAPQVGLGNYLLPIQIGARDMAFPRLNMVVFWAIVASVLGIGTAFFLEVKAGLTVWLASVALFCAGSVANALNFSITTIDLRAKGMTLPRLPITVWAWLINAILSMVTFSVLLATCVYLLADRILGTHFFSALHFLAAGVSPKQELSALWQRLFWFFAQALVYLAMLPCFGFATHLLATFSRRRIWAQPAVVLSLCAIGLFGFCIWGQQTFANGMDPYSPLVFSALAAALGLPASIFVMSWFGTLWNAKIRLDSSMLFALGFISLFLSGGLSGLILARHDLSTAAADDFIVGHYHLVMGVAATFAMLGALFFWYPKMFGRSLDERLGKIHFWLTFVGVYCVFMPMHWLGLIAHSLSSQEVQVAAIAAIPLLRSVVTVAALLTIAAQAVFLVNLVGTVLRTEKAAQENPWRATTLEWSLSSPPPLENFVAGEPTVYRAAYEFSGANLGENFLPQDLPPSAGELGAGPKSACARTVPPTTRPA